LIFAWLMQLATDVLANGDVNMMTVEELGKTIAPALILTENEVISNKLPRIIAVILRDKLDERTERQEALQGAAGESSSFDFEDEDDPPPREDAAAAPVPEVAPSPPSNTVESWDVQRVAEWIRGMAESLPEANEIATNFERDLVDGASLVALDKADFVRLGVAKIGVQKKLMKAIDDARHGR